MSAIPSIEFSSTSGPQTTKKYIIDVISAASASFLVSPFITIVDRSIIENASGARKLRVALKQLAHKAITRPHEFIRRKEFGLIFGLYFSTYATANMIETTCHTLAKDEQWPKFIGTTAVNMSLCIAKDREFTRMFGVIAPTKLPLATYTLFAIRDSLTVAASFNLPTVVSKEMQKELQIERSTANTLAQLSCPAAVQFISTPLHLLGLDLYNNPSKTLSSRKSFIAKEYLKSSLARIARIGPAFGIGGVSNSYFKDSLHELFLQ